MFCAVGYKVRCECAGRAQREDWWSQVSSWTRECEYKPSRRMCLLARSGTPCSYMGRELQSSPADAHLLIRRRGGKPSCSLVKRIPSFVISHQTAQCITLQIFSPGLWLLSQCLNFNFLKVASLSSWLLTTLLPHHDHEETRKLPPQETRSLVSQSIS